MASFAYHDSVYALPRVCDNQGFFLVKKASEIFSTTRNECRRQQATLLRFLLTSRILYALADDEFMVYTCQTQCEVHIITFCGHMSVLIIIMQVLSQSKNKMATVHFRLFLALGVTRS